MGSKNGTGTIAVNSAQIKILSELRSAFLNENANPSVWVDDSSLEIMVLLAYCSFRKRLKIFLQQLWSSINI